MFAEHDDSKNDHIVRSALPASSAGGEDLHHRVLNVLVAEYLKSRGYSYALSVFGPESGTHAPLGSATAAPSLSSVEYGHASTAVRHEALPSVSALRAVTLGDIFQILRIGDGPADNQEIYRFIQNKLQGSVHLSSDQPPHRPSLLELLIEYIGHVRKVNIADRPA